MKQTSKTWLGVGLLLVLIVGMALAYVTFREQPVVGRKEITIEVVDSSGTSAIYELTTTAEYLQQAMDEAEGLTYSGSEGPFGPMIETINGESAVYETDNAYWSFEVNGEYCSYGIAEQPVEDGDAFQIIYTPA